ncbi:hypothetical protein IQ06DRAFT_347466 [Phaeosphaeriaceae sp. SRC1lsM3a]|nr:hypothetical protein IQ06DRAFT_347466 [Stagonospora sp. SRC1lsM3a]
MQYILILLTLHLALANAIPTAPTSPLNEAAAAPSTPGIWSPIWLDAATYSLICYDAFAMGMLCWLWLCGHLAWLSKDRNVVLRRDIEMVEMDRRTEGRGRGTMIEGEMRRLGIF